MDRHEKRMTELLRAAGARIARQKRHIVYKFPDGRSFVQPKSGSDVRGIRNALSDLENMLMRPVTRAATPNVEPASVAANPLHRLRHRARGRDHNHPQRDPGETIIPKLGQVTRPGKGSRGVQFEDVDSVLEVLDMCDSFWELDACGRVRVLAKLISPFASVQPVSTRFFPIPDEGMFSDPARVKEALVTMFVELVENWGKTWSTGLLVHDREDGDILLEPMAMNMIGDVDEIIRYDSRRGMEFADFTIWETELPTPEEDLPADPADEDFSYEQSIFCLWLMPNGMRKSGCYFDTCGCWTNPAKTRHVIKEVLDLVESSPQIAGHAVGAGSFELSL